MKNLELGKQLALVWLDAYMKVYKEDRTSALNTIFSCGQALGPPGSNLRRAAMAYVGFLDQEWKTDNNELASNR